MSWVCPECGNDNKDEQVWCVCGCKDGKDEEEFKQRDLILFSIVGLVLIVIPVWKIILTESFLRRAQRVTASVNKSLGGRADWIQIQFRDSAGRLSLASLETGGEGTSQMYKKGDTLEILYDPKDPSSVRMLYPRLWYLAYGCVLVIGVCLFTYAGIIEIREYLDKGSSG